MLVICAQVQAKGSDYTIVYAGNYIFYDFGIMFEL